MALMAGISESVSLNTAMVSVKLAVLGVFVAAGLPTGIIG
jgi:hypothetical protein